MKALCWHGIGDVCIDNVPDPKIQHPRDAIVRIAGQFGTVLGTIAGGVAEAFEGKAVAESIDPTVEATYWHDAYSDQPYYSEDYTMEDYEPAYRSGWESYDPDSQVNWQDREAFERWESEGGAATMIWDQARLAAEDAYGRINQRSQTSNANGRNCEKEPTYLLFHRVAPKID